MIKQLRGSILLLITAMIWGTAFVAQSKGMDYIEPFTYNSVRTLIGGIILVPIITLFKKAENNKKHAPLSKASSRANKSGGICCGIILFIASSFQQYGISMTAAGKAGFITALYVVIVPILGIILKRKTGLKIWVSILIAVTGFYLLCIHDGFKLSKGDFYVLICAVFYAVHIVAVDYFNGKNTDGMIMSCIQFFTAGILMGICMFIFEDPHIADILSAKYTILYTGIMSCGVAYTLQIIGQKTTPPAIATLLMSLESVFAAISGWLFLSEKMSARELTGCILVFAAVISAQSNIFKPVAEET